MIYFCMPVFLFGLVACNRSSPKNDNIVEKPIAKEIAEEPKQVKVKASELKAEHDIPVAIPYAGEFKNSEKEPESFEPLIQYTEFYPLGWSSNGYFAWLEYSTTYFGGYVMTYSMKDMKSNKVIWSYTNNFALTQDANDDSEAIMDANVVILTTEESSDDKDFRLLWAFDEKLIVSKLKANDIAYQPSGKFLNTAEYKGLTFSIEMVEGADGGNPFEYHIKNSKGIKLLLNKHYQEARLTEVTGILESPFDNTFAVLCLQQRQFFEMTDEIVPFVVGFQE